MDPVSDPKEYRKTWLSWALYDVGNSAFYLVVIGSLFPAFYQRIYLKSNTLEGKTLSEAAQDTLLKEGGGQLALTALVATAIVAVLGPIFGTIADRYGAKKKFLTAFAGLGVVSSALMLFIGDQNLLLASILYASGTVGVAGSLVFYDALLPGIVRQGDLDRISTIGFALGYAGSPLLYIVNVFMVLHPEWFGLSSAGTGFRLAFFSVAVWWALFTIPLLRRVPEPTSAPSDAPKGNIIVAGFRQLGRTFLKIRKYKHLLLFLVAFWIYIDGVNTIIKLAVSFGTMLRVDNNDLFYALLITQFVGVPFTLAFGGLAKWIGAKKGILVGLTGYTLICIGAAFMQKGAAWQFYALAISVGVVQGGVQALSRSLFASMIPKENSAELFGFYSTMAKFASLLGPLVLYLVWTFGDDPRKGILAIVGFFLVGGFLLSGVDVKKGQAMVSTEGETA